MKDIILETKQLTKAYKGTPVVNQADIVLQKGGIYGLIGKNGAGKTTLIRMIGGLAYPTSGKIFMYGKKDEQSLACSRRKMSFIVETPYFEPDMTAYENLNLQRLQKGIADKGRIGEMLELVQLQNTGKKKAMDFSLGMRQRLGIAIAMLSRPEFLVLDEPINGLDPEGIRQMRELIIDLNKSYNATILISSHMLSELYQTATDYIIIDQGKVIEQISNIALDLKCKNYLLIHVSHPSSGVEVLIKQCGIKSYQLEQDGCIKIFDTVNDIGQISKSLVEAGLLIYHFEQKRISLEQYFLTAIGGVHCD